MENQAASLPITVDPETMGGVPVFRGTRVPIETMFEYLERNYSLEEFLDSFPSVEKEAALAVLMDAHHTTLDRVLA
ncbi:MAG TPA: DUF433 domain-containing protein [Candidatus Kapabacteria bacterium]|nr:DUF433 domain-containing protein [Candidatus Kapabacteria bacterium]